MNVLNELRLNQLSKIELEKKEMRFLKGGKSVELSEACTCSGSDCSCEKSGGTVCGVSNK